MKIYGKSVSRNSQHIRINYDAVDKVCDILEKDCQEIADNYDVNINIDYGKMEGKNSEGNPILYFVVECELGGDSTIVTPEGRTILITKVDRYGFDIEPITVDSKYGQFQISELMNYSGNELDLDLAFIRVANSNFEDAWIKDRQFNNIDISDVKQMITDSLDKIGPAIDNAIAKAIESHENYEKEQLAKAKRSPIKFTDKQVESGIIKAIKQKIKEAGKGLGFIDGDDFAFAQDELVYFGKISQCVRDAKTLLKKDKELAEMFADEPAETLYNCDSFHHYSNMSDIIALFRKHGKDKDIPKHYFE